MDKAHNKTGGRARRRIQGQVIGLDMEGTITQVKSARGGCCVDGGRGGTRINSQGMRIELLEFLQGNFLHLPPFQVQNLTAKWMQESHRDQSISFIASKAGSNNAASAEVPVRLPTSPTPAQTASFPEADIPPAL